jgi:hypothetical protein
MREIFKLHGLPTTIVLSMDLKFTSIFWKGIFEGLGTNMNFNTTHHLYMDGQTNRLSQVLEDMLCMYVMDKPFEWKDYLNLVGITW